MSGQIRIAHVNVARGYRGGERQTELLIRELAKRGCSQVLVGRRGAPLAGRLKDLGVEIRLTSGNSLAVFAGTSGVEIVHVHEGRSVYAAYMRRLVSGTPYVVTRRVVNPIGNHWLAHRAYREAARVAAISPAVADCVTGFDSQIRVTQVMSCFTELPVDREAVAAIRASFAGKFLVGHVAALDNNQKGQEYIIDAAADLAVSEPGIHFLIVGGGDDERMLRKKVAQCGIGNISFTGFVDNVGDYLASFDLFILPSNHEGLGSILLDAMQHKLPIIATRVGGIPAIIRDGETGVLIESRNPHQLRDAILTLRADASRMRAIGLAGFGVASRLTPDVMCRQYLDLYEQVLHRKH